MRKLLLFTMIPFLYSCKQKPGLRETLASECFWDITGDNQVIGGLNSCFRFLPNGESHFYYYNFYDKKITDSVYLFDNDDVIIPNTWTTFGDSILIARGTEYKILDFQKDSVRASMGHLDTVVFKRNCHTIATN